MEYEYIKFCYHCTYQIIISNVHRAEKCRSGITLFNKKQFIDTFIIDGILLKQVEEGNSYEIL